MDEQLTEINKRLDALEALIREQSDINTGQTEQITRVLRRHHRQQEIWMAALIAFCSLTLVLLFGLRIETSAFTFALPIELLAPGGAIAVALGLWVKDREGRRDGREDDRRQ